MNKKMSKKVIVASIVVAMLMLVSAMSISSTAAADRSTTLLIEVDNTEQLEHFRENGNLLLDYGNGRALVSIPKAEIQLYQDIYNTEHDGKRYELHMPVSGQSFDRREGMPSLDSELKYADLSGVKPYVVQFIGPVESNEWKQELNDNGAIIERSIANYAVLARMSPETRVKVSNLDIVSWTAPFHPGFKISDDINMESATVHIQVKGWDGVSLETIASRLDNIGATVGRQHEFGVIASVDPELLPTIGAMTEVYRIDSYSLPHTMDTVATDIHEATSLWYTSWSGLDSRITGSGQVVGIQDSGFDEGDPDDGHSDFFDGPSGDRVIRYQDRTGNSDPDGNQDGVAHGTHCAGIVLANGWCWDTAIGESTTDRIWHKNEATGMAPEAELSMDGVTASGGGIQSDPGYWDDQEADGARVFSNSWGAGPADYDGNTEGIDDRQDPYSTGAMNYAEEDIILFAAGNAGPGEDTISARPQTKNGLGIAASQNYRTEWHSAENPNKIADFSSRGGTYSNGRIKPDLAAVGTAVISALGPGEWDYWETNGAVPQPQYIQDIDEYDRNSQGPGSDGIGDYQYMQGTSMASPNAAGASLLVREYYTDIHGDTTPSNPLVKATMINGADRMSETLYDYPGYDQGWGRINLKNSLYPDAPTSVQFDEHTFTGTGTWNPTLDLNVNSGDVPLKATLVWTDESGIDLYRQLEFEMTDPSGDTYYSGVNNYDSNGWTQPNTDNGDTINNVHRVEVQSPEAGTWTMTVNANSIPSNADAAVVISADFGPQDTYDVDLQTDYPTTLSVVAGGQTQTQLRVRNWGTSSDTIDLTDDSDASLTLTYDPSSSLTLDSEEEQAVIVTIAADAGITPDVYEFSITGTSQSDTTVQDSLRYKVDILTEKLPHKEVVADASVDESYADVLTFTDSGGTDWIFLAYRVDTTDGQQVHVKHSQLGTDGRPTGWSTPVNVQSPSASPTETPAWIKLLHIPGGSYQDRVYCYWNGGVPGTDPYESEAKTTWTDAGSYGTWATPVQIDQNYGTDNTNNKRSSYMLWRNDGSAEGELTYVFEHLDSSESGGVSAIGIAYEIADADGTSWSGTPSDFPNLDTGTYYYFFPEGVTDQNNVNWHFFYYRESTGNSRMVVCYLQDDSGWSGSEIHVMGDLSGEDNHQFPRAAHLNDGGTNTVVCSALYDSGGVTYDLSTAYVTGDYTSASSPTFTQQDHVAGTEISDSGYIESNVLASTSTEDGYIWTGYQESGTIFDYVNLDAARTNDLYGTVTTDKVTRDNYAKLNPQMDSLTIGTTSYTYMSYHSSQGTATDVDYNIYLAIFHSAWESEADTEGPDTYNVATEPLSVAQGETFDLSATIDDTETGFSTIADAEWVRDGSSDPSAVDWTGATSMSLSSSSEIVTAEALNIDTSTWIEGTHRLWVRGQDDPGNWGTEKASYVDIEVTAGTTTTLFHDLGTLTAGGGHNGWHFLSYNLTRSDTSLTSILDDGTNGIAGSYDKVMSYDASAGEWKTYVDGRNADYNDLDTWDITTGIWVHMTADDDLVVIGDSQPSSTDITLYPGWTMVSYPSSYDGNNGLPTDVDRIGYYDGAATYNLAYENEANGGNPQTFTFISGQAYWIHNPTSSTLTWSVTY